MYLIQRFFGFGNVTVHGDSAQFQVKKLSDIACILQHFDNYPLKTKKHADFLLFKKAFNIIANKQHCTEAGLHKLISIRASLNKGLPERLQVAFPNVAPELRPEVAKANWDFNNFGDKS